MDRRQEDTLISELSWLGPLWSVSLFRHMPRTYRVTFAARGPARLAYDYFDRRLGSVGDETGKDGDEGEDTAPVCYMLTG